jgi:predicted dehydrogenase
LLLKGEVPNIFNPEYAGGSLMDINFYNVYLNVALFGKPKSAVYYPNIYNGLIDTSGIVVMQYDDFVSESSGAKDTWGVNFFQIEGEKGYIYIMDGSNGLLEIRVVTKDSDETFNNQDNPNRWYYEIQKITELVLAGDYERVYERLDVMLDVVEVLEQVRKEAGILFPGDDI